MGELQNFFTQLVYNISNLIPLGYAFAAGMVSAVNPCGFAMLPAYLGLYLGTRELSAASAGGRFTYGAGDVAVAVPAQLARAVLVTSVVTGGFIVLFGGAGVVITTGGRFLVTFMPWLALAIGGVLVLMGVSMMLGRHYTLGAANRVAAGLGDPSMAGIKGFFIFRVAFATASLSCTLPIFLTVVGGSLAVGGFVAAASQFVSYALGMGLVILFVTLGIAVIKGAVVGQIRAVTPYIESLSALLMVVAGSYIVYYWLFKGGLINSFA